MRGFGKMAGVGIQVLQVLYEDNHLLFVKKPPNMPVQADSSGDLDVLSALKAYIKEKYEKPGEVYLGLVHRLDRPVGGAVVFCRTSKAAARVSEQIRAGAMEKTYLAVVSGNPPESGHIVDYLVKDGTTNMVRVCEESAPGAKRAALSYETLAREGGLALVRVQLETGRSHQIRVQMKHAGFPLWGDNRYGNGKPGEQIALWSYEIGLEHPTKKEKITVQCPPPKEYPWTALRVGKP